MSAGSVSLGAYSTDVSASFCSPVAAGVNALSRYDAEERRDATVA